MHNAPEIHLYCSGICLCHAFYINESKIQSFNKNKDRKFAYAPMICRIQCVNHVSPFSRTMLHMVDPRHACHDFATQCGNLQKFDLRESVILPHVLHAPLIIITKAEGTVLCSPDSSLLSTCRSYFYHYTIYYVMLLKNVKLHTVDRHRLCFLQMLAPIRSRCTVVLQTSYPCYLQQKRTVCFMKALTAEYVSLLFF